MTPAQNKTCQNCKQNFQIEPEDFDFYEKMQVPAPSWCAKCRLQRRLATRNERSLYKRNCDLCGKNIIAMFSLNSPLKIYCSDCYYSDKWDPLEYGREYDFSKPFFEQWLELRRAVPHVALMQENVVDSPWVNYETDEKNCYLNFGGHQNQDSAYNQYLLKSKDSFDNFWVLSSEFAYESVFSERGYKVFFSRFCYDCRDAYFSLDCRDCSNIFGCTGLRHKQYHIFNKPVSKEEFEKFIAENLGSRSKLVEVRIRVEEFWKTQPQRAVFIERSVNVSGNMIKESKNCHNCWNIERTEDSKHILFTFDVKDAWDTTSVGWAEKLYEVIAGAEHLSDIKFSTTLLKGCREIEYSHFLIGCNNCFGSMHLKSKSYCILNKQYSKEEYFDLLPKIKEQMAAMSYKDKLGRQYSYGEFFPPEISPYGYNETVAFEYFPLTKDEAAAQGYNWSDYEGEQHHAVSDYVLPDSIEDVQDDVLEKILKDKDSERPYRLIPMELAFYRRMNLPVPAKAPFDRHHTRLKFIAEHLGLHDRECGKCGAKIKSVYQTEEFPIVYCEQCYQAEVV